ncbi:MAG: extracellular solute-binding protein [Enterocloster citroniae]|nr:extracellular solute-binding protein [Enterocloster citroniae]
MKKALSVLLVAGILTTTVLTGCGGGAQTAETAATPAASEGQTEKAAEAEDITQKVPDGEMVISPQLIGYENAEIEITWQPNASQGLEATSQTRVDYLTKKAAEWIEKHPNVKVIPVSAASNSGEATARLRMQAVEGNAPDVAAVDSFYAASFAEYAYPLNEIFEEKGISMDDFFPFMQSTMQPGGKDTDITAIWYTTDARALYYRKDILKEAPVTVDDVLEAGKMFQEKGMTGLLYAAGRGEGTVNNLLGLYWSQGVELFNEDGTLAFADGKGRDAMANYLGFVERTINEGITPQRVVEYQKESNMLGDIASGNVGMFIASSSAVALTREIVGEEVFNEQWGLAELPVFNEGDQSTSSAGGWTNIVFAKDEQKAKLAADFVISLYSDDEAAPEWSEMSGLFPTRMNIFETTAYLSEDPMYSKFAKYLDHAKSRPGTDDYSKVSEELQIAIGDIATGSKTAEAALDTVLKNLQK